MVEIPDELEGVRRLDLRPGDRCVLRVEQDVSQAEAQTMLAVWEEFAPGVKLLILPLGMTLTVIGKDEVACGSSA